MITCRHAPGVVVALQTKTWPFLRASFAACATGCMARIRNSFEKLPSGRLGVGTMKNDASVSIASRASVVARNRCRPCEIVSASRGSSTGGSPALMRRTTSGFTSTPSTSKPRCASVAAMQAPNLPNPNTESLLKLDIFVFAVRKRRSEYGKTLIALAILAPAEAARSSARHGALPIHFAGGVEADLVERVYDVGECDAIDARPVW